MFHNRDLALREGSMFKPLNAGRVTAARWSSIVVSLLALMAASAGTAMADVNAYEVAGNTSFGTIDLTTGVYTQIGVSGILMSGLGETGGLIYGGAFLTDTVYTVNPATGALTLIGTTGGPNFGDFGSTLTGLYAIDLAGYGGNANLWSINPATGAATLIGPTGLTYSSPIGMSDNSAILYVTNGPLLYSLNTTTGAATLVGNTGTVGTGGMVTLGGTLYGGVEGPLQVATLDPVTGAATLGPLETGAPSNFWALAADPPTGTAAPEPGYIALLVLGMAGMLAVRRTRARA
jgi:hypothetical protein